MAAPRGPSTVREVHEFLSEKKELGYTTALAGSKASHEEIKELRLLLDAYELDEYERQGR
jgi:hypothetical protein